MNEINPTHNTKPSYGWIRKGERKEILSNTGRQRVNISGAIDIVSKKVFVKEDETLDSDSTIDFLKFLEEENFEFVYLELNKTGFTGSQVA